MSLPATNNSTQIPSALNACLSNAQAQMAAMESLRETGERLFSSICRGDTDSLGAILESRSAACNKLNELVAAAPPVPANIDQLAASAQTQVRSTATEILRVTRQMDLLRMQILTRQSECEEALRAALADTARQLRQTAGEKKVRHTYQTSSGASPRFLDSRK